jgi:FkbM family methyltransferase
MTRTRRLLRQGVRWVGRRRWIRFGVRFYIARFVHDPYRAPAEEFAVPFYGLRYVGDFASWIDWNVYYFGAYSAAELELLGRILAELGAGCCLDIGANVGNHTLFLASRGASVIAFEPVPALAEQIRTRVSGNGLHNVEVVQCGLGDSAAELPFYASTDHNQGTGTFAGGSTNPPAEIISVRPGDELLAERGDPPVVLAKIDVEGFEPDVLRGLRRTLDRCRPIVFFEWSPKSAQRAGTADPGTFLPAGYSLFRFEPQVVWLWVFSRAPFAVHPWLPGTPTNVDSNLLAVPVEDLRRLRAVLGIPTEHEI